MPKPPSLKLPRFYGSYQTSVFHSNENKNGWVLSHVWLMVMLNGYQGENQLENHDGCHFNYDNFSH
jgi:hypothetical protein